MNENDLKTKTDKLKEKAPVLLAAGGGLSLFVLNKIMRSAKSPKVQSHYHGPLEHSHEHVHVTHNRTDEDKGVGGWEHLTASHSHRHNHAALEHTHRPHRNADKEHLTEAHVHDHDDPV